MALPRIWLLNFDADDELARPVGYTPPGAVLLRFAPLAARIGLAPPGDLVIEEWTSGWRPAVGTFEGRAFCPTPRALRALARAGASLPEFPSLEVLRRVNHRAFCAELGQCLPRARYVESRDELVSVLATSNGPWVMKRPFGFAGRGRRKLRSGELDTSVEPFVRASFDAGEGLQIEPWVDRTLDVALHGFLARSGDITFGDPTSQTVDESGAWVSTALLSPCALSTSEEDSLRAEGERVACALRLAGYFGPFGIDAFRWEEDGNSRFNPRSEINARYSMGWAVGMGSRRPDLVPQLSEDTEVR